MKAKVLAMWKQHRRRILYYVVLPIPLAIAYGVWEFYQWRKRKAQD